MLATVYAYLGLLALKTGCEYGYRLAQRRETRWTLT